MLGFCIEEENVKKFMGILLNGNAFDRLQLRSGEVMTRGSFTFDGRLNKEYDGIETQRAFCLWSEVKPNFYDLIKGKHLPKHIKLVFALDDEPVEKLHKNAKAAYINMVYENNKINFTTGTAQKEFSLDKSLDEAWEEKVKLMFERLGIAINILY